MKQRVCIYHAPCLDGTSAAWAVWRKFGDDDTEYLPAKYGDAPPDVAGRDVVIVDFSYKREIMLALAKSAKTILCLDHHKTAEADLKDLEFAVFDMGRSGAGMAWDHFHGYLSRPWLIDYVEDRDLWRFKLPQSKEVNAWIHASSRVTFEQWDTLSRLPVELMAEKGEAVLAYQNQYVEEMIKQARIIPFAGHVVPVVNAPYFAVSELVSALAEGYPFAVGWFQRASGEYQYSLRSRGEGGADVSQIAKQYGGGGHKNAAGFTRGVTPNDESMR